MQEVKLDEAPKRVRDLFLKAQSAMERSQLDYAVQMFGEVLNLEPLLAQARRSLRAIQTRKAREKKGMIDMTSFKAMGPMGRFKKHIKKEPAEALKAAEELMNIDPTVMQHINLYCDAAEAAGKPEIAIQELEVARTAHPQDTKLLYRLGDLYLAARQTREARSIFEEITRIMPTDQIALKKFKDAAAVDTMNTGGWEKATSYRDVIANEDQAKKLEQQGKAKKSEDDVEELINDTVARLEREPKNLNLYRHLGELYNQAKRYEEARDILTRANDMTNSSDPNIERALNDTYLNMYDYNIAVLTEAGDTEALEATKAEKAEFEFELAQDRVKKYPNDLTFKYDLGLQLMKRREFTGAIQQFQQSQKHPQRRMDSVYNLARCFKAKGNLDIAADALRTLLSEMPVMDNARMDALYELGCILEEIGQRPEALKVFKEIYAYDIGYKDIEKKVNPDPPPPATGA
jgi:tetratricopeptide (TPR) repeat protein